MQTYCGVSKRIDGCRGMLAQAVMRTHRRIGAGHRRWIDEEDLYQETLIKALAAEAKYNPEGGAKFSTFLFRSANWVLNRLAKELKAEADAGPPVELDASLPSGNSTVGEQMSGNTELLPEELNCIQSFVSLCRSVSDKAVAVLVRGFLFSDLIYSTPELCAEIARAATKLRIGVADFALLSNGAKKNVRVRNELLTAVSKHVMLESGTEEAMLRCLKCVECTGEFSLAAIRDGRFYVGPMTCRACFHRLRNNPVTCFGKPGGIGFSAEDVNCSTHCLDKQACKEMSMGEVPVNIEDVDFSAEEKVVAATMKKAAKPVKEVPVEAAPVRTRVEATKAAPAKVMKDKSKPVEKQKASVSVKAKAAPAKAASIKAAKDKPKPVEKQTVPEEKAAKAVEKDVYDEKYFPLDSYNPPADVVEWPYRLGSVYLAMFMHLYKGVSKAEFEKMFKGTLIAEHRWASRMKGWRNPGPHRKGHTWKLDEEGGRLRIYDVKYFGASAAPLKEQKVVKATTKAVKKVVKTKKVIKATQAVKKATTKAVKKVTKVKRVAKTKK